jgi:uncharacterized protein (TIGR00251 family)
MSAVRIEFRVSPGAARSAIVGRHGSGWKVRVAAPPEDGRANVELLRLLATVLGVAERSLAIVAGQRSRTKIVSVEGLDPAEVERRLERS